MAELADIPIGYFLARAMIATRTHVSAKLRPLGLTLPQYICMQTLLHNPGMSNAELARESFVTRQAMNAVLHGLEKSELVARPSTAASGRVLPARLTEQGEVLLAKAVREVWAAENEILNSLSEQERRELKRLLAIAVEPCCPEEA